MKLLILTQKVDKNDDILGFFHGWIAEFARYCEKVTVVALEVGEYDLPRNVRIFSLGKENISQKSKVYKVKSKEKYIINFYRYIWSERKNYDNVFVHMNQIYVLLGWLLWKMWGKKIGLWYAHGTVTTFLKLAEKMTDYIFTSTESGFRINSEKKKVVGQGIPSQKFRKSKSLPAGRQVHKVDGKFEIVSVGRMSVSKDYETLIFAAEILKKQNKHFRVQILGGPLTKDDELYFESMKTLVNEKQLENYIEFLGAIAYKNIPNYLNHADIFVNMGKTGSLDKVMVEAMASELPILTCNESVLEILGNYTDELMYPKNDFQTLAEKIEWLYNMSQTERKKTGENLRKIVEKDHSLKKLIIKILNVYRK